jgi:hypothetical protein
VYDTIIQLFSNLEFNVATFGWVGCCLAFLLGCVQTTITHALKDQKWCSRDDRFSSIRYPVLSSSPLYFHGALEKESHAVALLMSGKQSRMNESAP